MIEMPRPVDVAMSSSRDVEITLHLVQLHAAPDATGVGARALLPLGRLLQALATASRERDNLVKVVVVELRVIVVVVGGMVLMVVVQRVDPVDRPPVRPGRLVLAEHGPGEDQIARRVLHVDVQVVAVHRDDDVQVDLQHAPDASLDAELARLVPVSPSSQLGEGEGQTYE